MCQQHICPSNATYMPHVPITSCTYIQHSLSIYTSQELNAINNMTKNTAIYTFHIIGICPLTNMPAAFHIYMPLYYSCSLHKECPLNVTYMLHMEVSPFEDTRQLCQFIYLTWTQCNHQCEQKPCYTYLSHYWHVPLIKYYYHCTSTVLYRDPILLHMSLT